MLGRQDTPAGGDLESKLVWRCVPGRNRNALQAERVGGGRVDAAECRAAAAESGVLYDGAVGFGDVLAAAVRIRKGIDARPELALDLLPGAHDFTARLLRRHLAEVDVAAGVRADFETAMMQRAHLVPRHPRVANAAR